MFDEVLDALHRTGCRFVVIGSVARALTGEQVFAHDLDVMIDASPDGRRRLVGHCPLSTRPSRPATGGDPSSGAQCCRGSGASECRPRLGKST